MKTQSTHAKTAKAIREELKKAFPLVQFTVRARSFSGGDAVDIDWTNGPARDDVTKITAKYQYGHFDGMIDCYEYSNSRDDLPQVKYVQHQRTISEDLKQYIFELCKKTYAGWENLTSMDECNAELKKKWGVWVARDYIWRMLSNKDLTHGYQE